ncbi:MAG TPA: NAD-dependent epimerase/dehydratase family protein, partial [Gaiellaceae bacterium]
MRVVVTGGAGFIGSNLVDALVARGDEVTVVDNLATGKRENLNEAARFLEQDIRELDDLDAEVVFHLAAQADVNTSVQKPAYDAEVNVVGTVRVLEAARAAGAKVVFSSTGGAIYGDVERPAPEATPRLPVSPYGIAKLAGEEYLGGWNRIHGT